MSLRDSLLTDNWIKARVWIYKANLFPVWLKNIGIGGVAAGVILSACQVPVDSPVFIPLIIVPCYLVFYAFAFGAVNFMATQRISKYAKDFNLTFEYVRDAASAMYE